MEWRVVIVTGSKDLKDAGPVWSQLDIHQPNIVIHGGAEGADTYAHYWAKKNGRISVSCFPDYSKDTRAPLERNIFMLEAWPMAVVLGFPLLNRRGTFHTLQEDRKRNMETHQFLQ